MSASRRVRLVVAYDGAPFHGFAPNAGVRTVVGDLSAAIATVVRQPVELTGAGRTDAGVHAWGQVVSGDLPADTDLGDLARRLNKLCAPAIAVRHAEWAADDFDARFSARWREYRYDVWNAPSPNPLLAGRAWFVPQPLSLWAMQAACDPLLGEHDFTSFCRRPKIDEGEPEPSLVRRVLAARWSEVDGWDDGGGAAALRDPGQRLLPPDGALDRRHARRRRVAQGLARRHAGHPRRPRPGGRRPGRTPSGPRPWEVGYCGDTRG